MPDPLRADLRLRLAAWAVVLVFAAGFAVHAVGVWTLPILGVWFIGTQKPLAGAIWLLLINLGLRLAASDGSWLEAAPADWPAQGRALAVAMLGALAPLLLYRMLRPRRFPLLAGVSLPLAAGLTQAAMALAFGYSPDGEAPASYLRLAVVGVVVGLWIHEAGWRRRGLVLAALIGLAAVAAASLVAPAAWRVATEAVDAPEAWLRLATAGAAFGLAGLWTAIASRAPRFSADGLALLRSPGGGAPLHLSWRALATASGLRFPIRAGLARFAEPRSLGGMNARLNRLYANIASLYDDVQRIYLPLRGLRRDAYMAAYLAPLEVRPGDKVLETSIGTGANFRLLPKDIRRFGLDLSPDMLQACRDNFGRWGFAADLVQGNAEALPFADESFDVVFHVGGVNFFNDRASAVTEMIRVAKPGSRILIADETEQHVKGVYEAVPGQSAYFQARAGEVTAPVDLVPSTMQEVKLELLRGGSFYVLSFRKPAGPLSP